MGTLPRERMASSMDLMAWGGSSNNQFHSSSNSSLHSSPLMALLGTSNHLKLPRTRLRAVMGTSSSLHQEQLLWNSQVAPPVLTWEAPMW
jgi:hypothetical protein